MIRCCITSLAAFSAFLLMVAGANGQTWQDLGPGRIYNWRGGSSGRVSAVAAHPTTANTYYLGGADGGVWKTIDDGQNWTPLTDGMPCNAIGCITVDPANPNRVYVGTGEVNREGHCRYGLGVYRSDDGGATWAHLPRSGGVHVESTFDGRCIGRICVNPSNTNKLFAAVTLSAGDRHGKRHPYGENPRGLYASSDAGESWVHVDLPGTTNEWGCTDVAHVSGGTVFLAAVWFEAGTTARIYRTADAGATWSQVGGTFSQRILLAPATGGSIVWALDCPPIQHRLWRSADGGQTWSVHVAHNTNTNQNAITRIVLAVNPANADIAYFGGDYPEALSSDDLKRVVYPDTALGDVGTPHEDLRSIAWRADGHLMIGNDGGLEISINTDPTLPGDADDPISPGHWRDRNAKSLGITQIVPGVADHPTDPTFIYGGTQDNGSVRRTDLNDPRVWEHNDGGDGGAHVVDTYPGHTRIVQWPFTGGTYVYSDDDGLHWTYNFPPDPGALQRKYPQLIVDLTYAAQTFHPIYVGRAPLTVGFWNNNEYTYQYLAGFNGVDTIRGLAIGPHQGNSQRLYATHDNHTDDSPTKPSFIAVSDNGGASFDPNKPVQPSTDYQHWNFGARDVALDPPNPDVAFCVSSRWRTSSVPNRVFFTTNGGSTWIGRDGAAGAQITAAPCNAVTVVRLSAPGRRILVGTDQGLWISANDGLTWGKYGTGLPNSSVDDVTYDAARHKIFVATLGRGIWSVDYPAAVADIANATGEAAPDGKVDENDLNAFLKWMSDSDLNSKDAAKQDLCADIDGDGLVTVEDGLLFMEAYKGGW